MSNGTTLRDVAKQAGVSLGTASNVLNNKGNVSADVRNRVLSAVNTLGYKHPVRLAMVNSVPLSVIGVISKRDPAPAPVINPFYSHVLAGIDRECQRQNLSLMYANVEVDELNRPNSLPSMLLERQVDGMIMVGTFVEDTIHRVGKSVNMPVVLVDGYAPGSIYDSIVSDNLMGAYNAVKYLIDLGHRQIGLVGSVPNAYPSIRERRKGYVKALRTAGIPHEFIEDSPLSRAGGYNATMTLLQRVPSITAIFACNDEVAIGAMTAAREMDRDIPRDLSIVGFDDIDLAQEISPTLTTVHVDKVLMGVLAVRHLRDRAETPARPALTTTLGTNLIIRESVQPVQVS
ncbi:MAG: LacI family DNA-binding transcriptional regulator [Anaerolineae bacterium]|nr:LacI family DNA-binding transcriptional regulator [Anaerolineae bacterium]